MTVMTNNENDTCVEVKTDGSEILNGINRIKDRDQSQGTDDLMVEGKLQTSAAPRPRLQRVAPENWTSTAAVQVL